MSQFKLQRGLLSIFYSYTNVKNYKYAMSGDFGESNDITSANLEERETLCYTPSTRPFGFPKSVPTEKDIVATIEDRDDYFDTCPIPDFVNRVSKKSEG